MWATGERRLVYAALLGIVASCWLSATAQAAFPGHNGRIAYSAFHSASRLDRIFTITLDGTGSTGPISDVPTGDELDPAWSPDGSRIAYISHVTQGELTVPTVRVMNEDGSGDVEVDASSIDPREPSWSPDGTALAWTDVVVSGDSTPPRVVVKRLGGTGRPTPIAAPGGGTISGVAWSPEDTSIAFVWTHLVCFETSCSARSDPSTVAPNGGARIPLGSPLGVSATTVRGDVSWSPDGSRVAVSRRPGDLRVLSTTGAEMATIVPADEDAEQQLTFDSGRQIAWSPDGSRLMFVGAFENGSNSGDGLMVVAPTGTGPQQGPNVAVPNGGIDWQPLQPPMTKITAAPSAVTSETRARFAFVANKRPATYECRLDGRPWTRCASGIEYTGLGVGAHVFTVRATESHGLLEERPPRHEWQVVARPLPVLRRFSERTGIRARWYRFIDPHAVEFQTLRVIRVPSGVTIDVRCDGEGCPADFHRRWRTHRFRASKRVLAGLRGAQLQPRAAVFVTLSKPGYVGIGKMYCVRYNRRVRVRSWDDLDPRQPRCGPSLGDAG